MAPNRLVKNTARQELIGAIFTPCGFLVYYWFCMHCTEGGRNELCTVHASGVGFFSALLTLPSSSERFICLWRSRTKGIIQGKITDKGCYVRCNILTNFPTNNVGEGEVKRAEQYYPTICSLPPLGVSLLSADVYLLYLAHVLSLTLVFHTPTSSSLSVNPLISSLYSVV